MARKPRNAPAEVTNNGGTTELVSGAQSATGFVGKDIQGPSEKQCRESSTFETLGRLTGGVVHDLNNVLTGIMLYSDLLLKVCAPGVPQSRYAEEIRSAAQRGASMIEQLMSYARQQPREPAPLSLDLLIRDMKEMLQKLAGRDVELVTTFAKSVSPVSADPVQMQQVIVNLVTNARDAMPNGGRITIATRTAELSEPGAASFAGFKTGTYVCVSVTDTGCGMDAETRAHLFEPFFSTKGNGKGIGLGLATVHDIVTRAGGTISVESEPGKGTCFTILLPAFNSAPVESSSRASSAEVGA